MTYLKVRIIQIWDSEQYPSWAECSAFDAFGIEYRFRDKTPVFSANEISSSMLPCEGMIRCSKCGESNGTIQIDTTLPDHIESMAGQHLFFVFPNQLTDR